MTPTAPITSSSTIGSSPPSRPIRPTSAPQANPCRSFIKNSSPAHSRCQTAPTKPSLSIVKRLPFLPPRPPLCSTKMSAIATAGKPSPHASKSRACSMSTPPQRPRGARCCVMLVNKRPHTLLKAEPHGRSLPRARKISLTAASPSPVMSRLAAKVHLALFLSPQNLPAIAPLTKINWMNSPA